MRRRIENPLLLLGAVGLGVTAALLLDGELGRKRRRRIAATTNDLRDIVADRVSDASSRSYDAASQLASSLTDRLGNSARTIGSSVRDASVSALSGSTNFVGALPSRAIDSLAAFLSRRNSRLEEVQDSLSNGADRLTRFLPSWNRVNRVIDRGADRVSQLEASDLDSKDDRAWGNAPKIGAGLGLLLAGGAMYLLLVSPKAKERRRHLRLRTKGVIHDVGEVSRSAGRRVSHLAGFRGEPSVLKRVRNAIAEVTSDHSEVSVIKHQGDLILQGSAAPEEYDRVVDAIRAIEPNFINELQVVSAT